MIDAGLDVGPRPARVPGEPACRCPEDVPPAPLAPFPGTVLASLIGEKSPAVDALWEWARVVPPLIPMSLALALGEVAGAAAGVLEAPPLEGTVEPAAPSAAPAPEGEAPAPETEAEAPAAEAAAPAPAGPAEAPEAAPPAAPEATTPTPTEPEGAADSAESADTSGLGAWSSRVRTAIGQRIKAPPPADAEAATAPVCDTVTRVRRRESARRAGTAADVKRNLPAAPPLPASLPAPPAIPMPEAESAVKSALGKQLPQQVLPPLQEYVYTTEKGKPVTFTAQVGLRLPEGSTTVMTPVPPPPKPGREGRGKLAKVKAAGEKITPVPAINGAFTLGTVPPPGTKDAPAAPRVTKADITGVLVRLRASIPEDSTALLNGVRESMYPGGALQIVRRDLGQAELLPGVSDAVTRAVDLIATQSGIDLDELHTATLDKDGKVQLAKQHQQAAVDKAHAKAKGDLDEEGKKSADSVSGTAAGAQAAIDQKLLEASGGASSAQIRQQRNRLIARVNRRLAPEDIRYEKEGDDRLRALQLMEVAYTGAYQYVSRQVAERIRKDSEPPPTPGAKKPTPAPKPAEPAGPPPPPSTAEATPAEAWTVARINEVRQQFASLRKVAQDATKANRGAITSARNFAVMLLTEWSEREIGDRETGWEHLWARIRAWGKAADDKTLAWEEARTAQLGADLRGDLAFVDGITSGAHSEAEMKAVAALGGLSNAQQAIVTTYFAKPPPRNPLDAVAAGMRVRIAEAQKPRLTEELRRRLYALPPDEWRAVAKVAESEGGNVVILDRGNQFYAAVDQWGTDEAKLYAALTGLTELQRHALDLWYQKEHGSTIDDELEDELSDAELDRARDLMSGDQLAADAAAIRASIDQVGTDEEEIYRALRNKTAEERKQLEAIYHSRYGTTLDDDLKSDMSGQELARARALAAGNVREADAIGLQAAQSGKWYGGVDTDAIQAIYATNRAEVEAEASAKNMTGDEMNAAVLARNKEIDEAHKQHYRRDAGDAGPGLRASFEKNLTGPARDLALGLQDQKWDRIDAARLELERRSFITSDKVVNQILESQFTRAQTEVRLDKEHDLAYRRDLAAVRGEHWDEKEQRKAMEAGIDDAAQKRSCGYMKALQDTYDGKYKNDPLYAVSRRGGFDNLIADHVSGSDQDRARALVAGGGRLRPDQEIQYAVQGPGTDTDVLRRVLQNKTPQQIEAISTKWDEEHPHGPKLRDRIMEELSGRDEFDIGLMLEGAPETPEQKLALAKRKQQYEHTAYALGGHFSTDERAQLDDEVTELENVVKQLHDAKPGSKEAAFYQFRVDQSVRAVDSAVDEHRRSVDSIADRMAMIAAIAAGLLVTAVTFGAAGPVVAGALGALAAAEATIITKMAFKGTAYSNEELLVDVVSGAVDVVFAVLTAGVGNALMRVSKGVPIGPLAKLATSASRAKRMIAHGLANGVEGFLSGIPSAAAGSLVDEKTWTKGDPLTNFVTATGMGAATGALMGGVMGSAGGWSKAAAHGPHLDPGRPPDLEAAARAFDQAPALATVVDPATRAGQWHAHQAQHPGASYADFVADLEAGRILPEPHAAQSFRQAAREQLVAGLPASDRKVLDDIPVHVLTDAEFTRVTRSSKGQAVTIIDQGKAIVLVRESAPISALREEGIHAAQLLDPRTAADVKLLDEAHMARWNSLDLNTKIEMYRAKLDLEIDAHQRLIIGLLEQIDEMPPGVARDALVDQAGAARRNLQNLGDRRIELASFGPLDRLKARLGFGTLDVRLEQPPRLFMKTPAATKKTAKAARAHPDKAQFGGPPEPTARRRTLGDKERSPQIDQEGVVEVKRVGPEWREHSARGEDKIVIDAGDRYRRVEVTKADGTKTFVDETVVRDSRPPRWVRRGKDASEAGAIAEEASLALTRRKIEDAPKGVTIKTLGSDLQTPSGHGFDEVYVEFHANGEVKIVVVEVKDYGSRWVPLEDFTAITTNLEQNLEALSDRLLGPRSQLPAGLKDLEPGQLKALQQKALALTSRNPGVILEVRLGPTTYLGGEVQTGRAGTALDELKKLSHGGEVRLDRLKEDALAVARRVDDLKLPDEGAGRLLDLHDSLVKKGLMTQTFTAIEGQPPGVFLAADGRVGKFRSIAAEDVLKAGRLDPVKLDKLAAEVVDDLRRQVQIRTAKRDVRVILDTSTIGLQQRLRLEEAIDRRLKALRLKSVLTPRLHIE